VQVASRRGCALLLLLASTLPGCRDAAPHFALLLTVDTLRADALAAYGNDLALTPTLDALAAESVVFEHCYAPAPFTLASVAGLLTGRYPEALGVTSNKAVLPPGPATLAEELAGAGWATAAVVSNFILREQAGLARGFQRYDANFPEAEAVRGAGERTAPGTTAAALAVLDELLQAGPESVFLWVHYQDPHGPYTPPDGYRERYLEIEAERHPQSVEPGRGNRGLGTIPHYQFLEGHDEAAWYRAGYDGEIRFLDDHVAKLFEGLRQRGLWDAASIVFAADHGEGLGEGNYWFAHGEFLHDPLVRVPCLLRFPGVAPARLEGPVALLDLAPTLLAQLGLAPPEGLAGIDLLDAKAQPDQRAISLSTLDEATLPTRGLVWRGWKYVVREAPGGPREWLYPLGDESHNRVQQHPRVLERMRARFRATQESLTTAPTPVEQELSAQERERLRALGYGADD